MEDKKLQQLFAAERGVMGHKPWSPPPPPQYPQVGKYKMLIKKEFKKLVLNVSNPDMVTSLIPTAKTIEYKGRTLVVVPHKDDEVRILNNIGISAPMPINYYYDWPGQFTPFDHQRVTASFLTQHLRSFCLNDMGCVDSETEYLSPAGWKKISEYAGGMVAQYHPDTGVAEMVEPTEYVKLPCDTMVHLKTKYGVDQLLSLEHRVLLQSRSNPDKREVVQAAELLARHNDWLTGVRKPKSPARIAFGESAIPVTFSTTGGRGVALSDAELRVQVAVIADGHFQASTNLCTMRLKKERKKERVRALLSSAGIDFTERSVDTATAKGFTTFRFHAPTHDKVFTERYWGASAAQLAVIADEVLYWDGNFRYGERGDRFSTTSKASADFVQYAMASTGRTARLLTFARDRRDRTETEYVVQVRNSGKALQIKSLSSSSYRRPVMELKPSTDGFKYCFMVPSTFLVLRRNGCVFCTGNTGKTYSVLWAYDYLRSIGKAHKMLIVSPLSTLEETWGNSIFRGFPHLTFAVLHGSRQKREKLLKEDVDVYIINPDGLKIVVDQLSNREDVDVVVIDEIAQAARNKGTDRWKALRQLVPHPNRICWGLTGTPTPTAPTDAWAQCLLVTPDNVPKYFGAFKDATMYQAGPYKLVPRPNAMELVAKAMQPSIRYKRDDCIDLPAVVYETRSVEMTAQQKDAYRHMLTKLHAEVNGAEITAVNEAVKVMKLVQIAVGAAYDNDGGTVFMPASNRLAVVEEIIEQAGSKVIVFVPFTGALEAVAAHLRKLHTVEVIQGATSKGERDRIFREFQHEENPKVLVAQASAMSHGLTLTAASVIIWFAPVNSLETYQQACARITRPGQKLKQLIVNIEACPVETAIYSRLQSNGKMQGLLLQMIEEGI